MAHVSTRTTRAKDVRLASRTDQTDRQGLHGPQLEHSQLSRDITCAFPRFSFHSCNYGIQLSGVRTACGLATCSHECRCCFCCTARITATPIQRWKHISVRVTSVGSIMRHELRCIGAKRAVTVTEG
jgi:hypothetical protein